MKYRIAALLTLLSTSAFGGNGAGTMGRVIDDVDYSSVPAVRFEKIVDRFIEVSVMSDPSDESIEVQTLLLEARDIPVNWRIAISASAKEKSWKFVESWTQDKQEQVP